MPASRCPSASLLLVVSLLATRAAAQPSPGSSPERTFQPWVVFSANAPASGGLLTSTYSPPFDTGAFQSTASQTLTLDPATARGFEAGADYFVTPGVGVRALVSYSRAAFSGENGPYAVTLLYTSMQPPDFVPRQFLYQRETPWPATEGAFRQLNISVGGVGRWHSTRGFGATAYAGLGYLRMSGETQSIAYTSFHLGGHSVLFPEEYRLSASLGPSSTWGLTAGGELDIPVASSLSVVVGYRAFVGRAARLSVRLDSILNLDQIGIRDPFSAIEARLRPTAELKTTSGRLVAGVKIKIGSGSMP